MRLLTFFRPGRLLGLVVMFLGLLVLACTPSVNMSLERARADFQQAKADPAIKADAGADLLAAEKLLQRAENNWQEHEDDVETDHLAYLTELKLDLARATAGQLASKRTFDELSAKKDEIRLQAREDEIARLKAKRVPEGILVTLGDVLFDTGLANLKAGSIQNIYPLVEYLKAHGDTQVKIAGHTDSKGSGDYNLGLSQNRAEAVRDFLISNGIGAERISAQGMGEDYPVATNSSAAGRQQNRRVEVTITNTPGAKGGSGSGNTL